MTAEFLVASTAPLPRTSIAGRTTRHGQPTQRKVSRSAPRAAAGASHPTSRGGRGWCGTSTGGLTAGGREACDGITHMHPTATRGATFSQRVGGSVGRLGDHTGTHASLVGGVGA
jgi:hypothetical protein